MSSWNSVLQARTKTKQIELSVFYHIDMKRTSGPSSGHIQKLAPLGEAHGVISSLQLWVLSQLTAHQGHLVVHIHEKPVLHVLQGDKQKVQA